MVSGTLYSFSLSNINVSANKVLIASNLSDAEIKIADKSSGFDYETSVNSNDFKAKFPLFKGLAFEGSDSVILSDCDAILYHVSKDELTFNHDHILRALNHQLVSFASKDLHTIMSTLCYPGLGLIRPEKTEMSCAVAQLHKCLNYLNSLLSNHKFLLGDKISLCDVAVFCELVPIFELYLEESPRKKYSKVLEWMNHCFSENAFKSVIKSFNLCTTPVQFDNAVYDKLHAATKLPAKGSAKSGGAKKEKVAPKEENIDDDEPKPVVKAAGPFDHLPPTTFNMEDWKRMYSNNKAAVSMPWLWEHFDNVGYSLWWGKYKYCNELEKDYLIDNLILGMFRRLTGLTKFAFGVVYNCGTSGVGNFELTCVFLLRGQTLAFEVRDEFNDDAVHYDWRKLDPANEKDRQTVHDYFSLKEDIGKFPLLEAHIFK